MLRTGNHKGFTVVEIVIAVALSSLVIYVGWLLVTSYTSSWVETRTKGNLVAEADLLKETMLNGRGADITGLREAFSYEVNGKGLKLNGYCGQERYYVFDESRHELYFDMNGNRETLVYNTLGEFDTDGRLTALEQNNPVYDFKSSTFKYRYRVEEVSFSDSACFDCQQVDISITLRDEREQTYTLRFSARARQLVAGQCSLDAECPVNQSCVAGCCESSLMVGKPCVSAADCDDDRIETIDICNISAGQETGVCAVNTTDKMSGYITDNGLWGTGGWQSMRALLGQGNQTVALTDLLANPGFSTQAAVYAPPLNQYQLLDIPSTRMPDYNTYCLTCHSDAVNWSTNPHGGAIAGASDPAPCVGGDCAQDDYCGYPVGRGKVRFLKHTGLTIKQVHDTAALNSREYYRTEDMLAGGNYVMSCVDCHETNHNKFADRGMMKEYVNGKAIDYPVSYSQFCTACHSTAPAGATLHTRTVSGNVYLYDFEEPEIFNAVLSKEYGTTPAEKTACFLASTARAITLQGRHLCAENVGLDDQATVYSATLDYSGIPVTSYRDSGTEMVLETNLPSSGAAGYPGPGVYNVLLDMDYLVEVPPTTQPYQIAITETTQNDRLLGSSAQWLLNEGVDGGTLTPGDTVTGTLNLRVDNVAQNPVNITGQVSGKVGVEKGFSTNALRFRDDAARIQGMVAFADDAGGALPDNSGFLDIYDDFSIIIRLAFYNARGDAGKLPAADEFVPLVSKFGSDSPFHGWAFGMSGVAGHLDQFRLVFLSSCSSGYATQVPASIRSAPISLNNLLGGIVIFQDVAMTLSREQNTNDAIVKFYDGAIQLGYENAGDTGRIASPPLNAHALMLGGPESSFSIGAAAANRITLTSLHGAIDAVQVWHHEYDFSLLPPILP